VSIDASAPLSGTALTLRGGGYLVELSTVGATVRVLRFGDRDLIVPFARDEVRPAFRGATLAPWPNRIVDGEYRFAGETHRVALTEPERGHALHGLVGWHDFAVVAHTPERALLTTTIAAQSGYPWRVRVDVDYRLDGSGLTQTVTAVNLSDTPAPFGTGPHPYLLPATGSVDEALLHLPASRVLEVTRRRLKPLDLAEVAVDAARFDFREPRVIGEVCIDHAFTDLARDGAGVASVTVTDAAARGARITFDAGSPWVQICTADQPGGPGSPGHRIGVAVEPMTCAPDAFNAERYPFDTGVRSIAPGEAASVTWTLSAVGD
jgi:aldose 1-epimerase